MLRAESFRDNLIENKPNFKKPKTKKYCTLPYNLQLKLKTFL